MEAFYAKDLIWALIIIILKEELLIIQLRSNVWSRQETLAD